MQQIPYIQFDITYSPTYHRTETTWGYAMPCDDYQRRRKMKRRRGEGSRLRLGLARRLLGEGGSLSWFRVG